MPSPRNVTSPLAHVLWIGGAPDAGKSSIAQVLAAKYHLQLYSFDHWEAAHFARFVPELHPAMHAVSPSRMTTEQRWVLRSPQVMVQQTIAAWSERFAMTVKDVLAMPSAPLIVAEGPGLFPDLVAPLLAASHQAIWLVPTDSFKWQAARQRNKLSGWDDTSDPERAQRNWFERDTLLAAHIKQRAIERQLTIVDVDGAQSLPAMAALVERHFTPLLQAAPEHLGIA